MEYGGMDLTDYVNSKPENLQYNINNLLSV